MKTKMEVDGRSFDPGTKEVVAIPVTTDLDNTKIQLWVHVISGTEPGPTLALLSTLHGGEFLSIEVFRRLVERLDPSGMRGNVLAVPVGNPVAFQRGTRNTQDESDAPDLNRVFPGEYMCITEQLAKTITESVLKNADYVIDFHSGSWADVMGTVMYGIDFDEAVSAKSRELAFAFGHPSVQSGKIASGFPGPRSACGYAGKVLGIPNLVAEVLGAGFDEADEEKWIENAVKGIRNVMKYTGILDGKPDLPERVLVWQKRWRVNPSVGGYLLPRIPRNSLMREVKQGELLAQVVSPYTFEVVEELRSPGEGVLFMTARPYPVRPGDWAYCVIDLEDENTQWIDNPLCRG